MLESAENPNVNPESPVKTLAASKKQQELMNSRLISAKFGNIVTVLMQSEHHKNMVLSDLKDHAVPPLMRNQYRLAEAHPKGSGATIPVGLITWARVSQEVHDRLVDGLEKPILLTPAEWTSGDHYWIIDAVGDQRFLAPLLSDLRKTDFKNQKVFYRMATAKGPELKSFEEKETTTQ